MRSCKRRDSEPLDHLHEVWALGEAGKVDLSYWNPHSTFDVWSDIAGIVMYMQVQGQGKEAAELCSTADMRPLIGFGETRDSA